MNSCSCVHSRPGDSAVSRALQCSIVYLALILACPASPAKSDSFQHDIRPGPGVTQTKNLSDYLPSLAGTPGDTPIYILNGQEPGGIAFVAGGTHANEIAGIVAATVLVEQGSVQKGKLIVIPHANNSACRWTDPKRPYAPSVTIETASGARKFSYGARLTRPKDQGEPDPAKYRHPRSREELDGSEARNLDRAYPGKVDGNLTQRIAYAIVELLKKESVDIAFDFHEAAPESRLAWMVVANPKNIDPAALAIVNLDAAGIPMKLEPSSEDFRGLSHREWGDATQAKSFLFETPNPAMVEKTAGIDVVHDSKYPLSKRVGIHLSAFLAIVAACNDEAPVDRRIMLLKIPGWPEMSRSGLEAFLR